MELRFCEVIDGQRILDAELKWIAEAVIIVPHLTKSEASHWKDRTKEISHTCAVEHGLFLFAFTASFDACGSWERHEHEHSRTYAVQHKCRS